MLSIYNKYIQHYNVCSIILNSIQDMPTVHHIHTPPTAAAPSDSVFGALCKIIQFSTISVRYTIHTQSQGCVEIEYGLGNINLWPF